MFTCLSCENIPGTTNLMDIKYLLLMLLFVKGIQSFVIRSRSTHTFVRGLVHTNGTSRPPYNATCDCLTIDLEHCVSCDARLYNLTFFGYPWPGVYNYSRKKQIRNTTVKGALDAFNHVCDTAGRAQRCLQDRCVQDYCFVSTTGDFRHNLIILLLYLPAPVPP